MKTPDLRLGDWRDVLAHVQEVDAVITDGPFSQRTHEGHDGSVEDIRIAGTEKRTRVDKRNGCVYSVGVNCRRQIKYAHWTPADVESFVAAWVPRCRGWFVCISDSFLSPVYEAAFASHGLTTFAPVTVLIPGMSVRLAGDGPSSWTLYVNVARPKALSRWGTLPGGYTGGPGERVHIGGKPLWLMRALVRDYTLKGDLVVDPCAGAATTLIAAAIENRRAIGAEVDPETYRIACARLRSGYTPSFDFGGVA